MITMISCACGHVGLADASTLPRELQCSACGDRRFIAPKDGRRIENTAAREELVAAILAAR
jgi:hypothetical protein